MAYISGLFLIDAPASALNNGQGEDTKAKVKAINVRSSVFPYVSAQSFRYWLRGTLEDLNEGWVASSVFSAGAGKKQQAYTEGDPVKNHDDDLLGYMRAIKEETVTRVSPLRTSTLVSLAPVQLVDDFGVMARLEKQEGDKEGVLLHGHEFYRAVFKGLFSLDLRAAGTFSNQMRTGHQNLLGSTDVSGLEAYADGRHTIYRLPFAERARRVSMLLRAMGRVQGGAKQTLHYTDTTPVFAIMAVTRGGNNIFSRVVTTDNNGQAKLHEGALDEALTMFRDELLSSVYVGRAQGFMDGANATLEAQGLTVMHPRHAFDALAADMAHNPAWMD